MPALPSWLTTPLWDQFAALIPPRPVIDPSHPLRCHWRRINDRVVFDKLIQVLRFGCSYEAIADTTCSASTIRNRRDEWIKAGLFAQLKQIALDAYDRIVGLCWNRSRWTDVSPRPPVAASALARPRSTGASRA